METKRIACFSEKLGSVWQPERSSRANPIKPIQGPIVSNRMKPEPRGRALRRTAIPHAVGTKSRKADPVHGRVENRGLQSGELVDPNLNHAAKELALGKVGS